MGSNKPTHINENVYLSIKSSSSSFNDKSSDNRGKAVENRVQACGKSGIKSAKPVEKDVKKITSHVAEAKANVLVAIFNAPHCREFFLKCVYHLPEQDIARAVDVSTRPNIVSPIRYFNKTCKQMMVNRGL